MALLLAITFGSVSCAFVWDELTEMVSDVELVRKFEDNRSDFDRLVKMSDEDGRVIRIAYDFTWVHGERISGEMGGDRPIGFSEQRWDEYKQLFRKLKLKKGLSRSETGSLIFLLADTKGLVTGGLQKGYMFSREAKVCDDQSLDDLEVLKEKNFACKSLDGPWSLYISR